MPTWHELPAEERLAVVTYVKTSRAAGRRRSRSRRRRSASRRRPRRRWCARENALSVGQVLPVPRRRGQGRRRVGARPDGRLKFPIRPTDFTRGQLKGGSTARDVYRAMTLGPRRDADALVRRRPERRGALGHRVLRAVALGLAGSAHGPAPDRTGRSPRGARRGGDDGRSSGIGAGSSAARARDRGAGRQAARLPSGIRE